MAGPFLERAAASAGVDWSRALARAGEAAQVPANPKVWSCQCSLQVLAAVSSLCLSYSFEDVFTIVLMQALARAGGAAQVLEYRSQGDLITSAQFTT